MGKAKRLLRILSVVCGLVLSFSLCACSPKSGGNEDDGGVSTPPEKVFYTIPLFEPVFVFFSFICDFVFSTVLAKLLSPVLNSANSEEDL